MLMSNVQVSKLIRKDMKMFVGSKYQDSNSEEKRKQAGYQTQPRSPTKHLKVEPMQKAVTRTRNSLLDDASSDEARFELQDQYQLGDARSHNTRYREDGESRPGVAASLLNLPSGNLGLIAVIPPTYSSNEVVAKQDPKKIRLLVRTRTNTLPDEIGEQPGRYAERGSPDQAHGFSGLASPARLAQDRPERADGIQS